MRMRTRSSAATWLPGSSADRHRARRRRTRSRARRAFPSNMRRTWRGTRSSIARRARLGATAVAVAHTKDDQAETFLLRLLRGAGPRGLSGIHPRAGIVVRPFIDTSRSDVREFLRAAGITFREDASNADRRFRAIASVTSCCRCSSADFSPGIVDVLDREAAIAREDADYLDAAARALPRASSRRPRAASSSTRRACWPSRRLSRGG